MEVKELIGLDINTIRAIHQKRMTAFNIPLSSDYELKVVMRILDFKKGRDSRPESHSHSLEEIGMCVECDAAGILQEWDFMNE